MIHILPGVDAPYALMTQADLNALAAAGQSTRTFESKPTDQPGTSDEHVTAHIGDTLANTCTVVTSWTATATAMRRFQFFIGETMTSLCGGWRPARSPALSWRAANCVGEEQTCPSR